MEHFDTTSNFISNHVNSSGYTAGDVIKTYGYSSLGGVGGSRWKATGNIIAASQDPLALNDIKMSDASGNEFELMVEESGIIDLNVLGGTSAGYVNIATNAGLTFSQGLTSDVSNDIVNIDLAQSLIDRNGTSVGEAFMVADRANGIFDAKTGLTANGYDILQSSTDVTIQYELRIEEQANVAQLGAVTTALTDNAAVINRAVTIASQILRNEGGGQDMDVVRGAVYIPEFYYVATAITMANNVDLIGIDVSVSGLYTDQNITIVDYPDNSPDFYTSANVIDLFIFNETGSVGKGIHMRRGARNNYIRARVLGFTRNIHIEDSFTVEIDRCHLAGQNSDNNLLITGSIVGEVRLTNSRLDGSNAANVFWNEADRGELVIRNSAIQFCQEEAILSRTCQHVTLDNVFFESCYMSSAVAGYWVDLQGATPRPNAVTTGAIVKDCSFAGSTDSGTDPAGLGLVKFNVFDHVRYEPKWSRHYNGVAPTVTSVKNFASPRAYLDNTTPYSTGLGLNTNQDELSVDAQLAISSDFDSAPTKSGIEIRTRTQAGSAWEYAGLYKFGEIAGLYHPQATPGLTGKPACGFEAGSAVLYDDTNVKHFEGKNDGFSFMPRCYANTTASAANVVVSSTGNMQRSTSSRRWKENERASNFDTTQVYTLNPVLFDYKPQALPEGGRKEGEKDCISFIAEDSGPYASLDEGGTPDGINWNLITLSLVEEIKKLKKEIEYLKS